MSDFPADGITVLLVGDSSLVDDLADFLSNADELTVETGPTLEAGQTRLEATPSLDCLVLEAGLTVRGTLPETVREALGGRPAIVVADRQTSLSPEVIADSASASTDTGTSTSARTDAVDYIRLEPGDRIDYALLENRLRIGVEATHHRQRLEGQNVEEQAWADEARLKSAAMDAAPIGIQLSDPSAPDNPVVYTNEGFQRLTGYPASEILGRNCRFLQGPETDPEPVAQMRQAIADEEPVSVELRNYRRNGTPFWNQIHIAPIRDDEDELTHFVGFQLDITERKRKEQELEAQNERLEQFVSVVSHDLRNPLSVAASYLEAARTEATHATEHLEAVAEAHDRMERLIEDLLVLARDGQQIDDIGPVDFQSLADQCWQHVSTAEATLVLELDGQIHADADRLAQLLENLFRNSVEHGTVGMADNEPLQIRVGPLEGEDEGGSKAKGRDGGKNEVGGENKAEESAPNGFYIEDNGSGIPPELRTKIFEEGYTTGEDGSGLGLQIVRTIVDAHGWSITATEGTDGGARFEITGVDLELRR